MSRLKLTLLLLFAFSTTAHAMQILIPMDESQKNHLKSYGIAFWLLKQKQEVQWLLNYNGGSFMFQYSQDAERECKVRGVSYETISDAAANAIITQIQDPAANLNAVKLLNAPKIAVYSPKTKQPWDDAVTLVLTYAEIPYDVIFDDDVLSGKILEYDWLHLHHEDFTGQYGKFYASAAGQQWYQEQVKLAESNAKMLGFKKVSQLKLAVAKNLKNFVFGGGFLFTMCSGTDSFDIGLSAEETDICDALFDGDRVDPNAQSKLDFTKTFAFEKYHLNQDPMVYEYSDIDASNLREKRIITEPLDVFTLFDFSAKWDVVPTMLTQCHTNTIKGFMGQTTDFHKEFIKSNVLILGENKAINTARYIHGELGQGTWTFYGGHDPEDYQHFVGDPETDLNLHPNSPGYRLILNNILFPAAKKKKRKT